MSTLPPSPFLESAGRDFPVDDPVAAPQPPVSAAAGDRFVLDEAAFMAAIEEPPAFLSAPTREFLAALERA